MSGEVKECILNSRISHSVDTFDVKDKASKAVGPVPT